MKQQVSQKALIAVIAIVVLVLAFFGWRVIKGPDAADEAEANFRKVEAEWKAQGKDVRNDPMLAQMYYKYHPGEKPPAGQAANPLTMAPGPRAGMEGGMVPGLSPPGMPLAPPPMRTLPGQ